MGISKEKYGIAPDGQEIFIFTLTNRNGVRTEITNYGGTLLSLYVPDKDGNFADVVLGFGKPEDYFVDGPYFGAIIGRHANRIEDACFELGGENYQLARNDGNNHLHGGKKGFDKVVWNASIEEADGLESLKLSYLSRDGEENYPGNLDVSVTYTMTDDNSLNIDYEAVSDRDTVINLTNHAYFNLSGHASGDVLDHCLMINADSFTAINDESIPTGEIRDVKGTVFDFNVLKPIGDGFKSSDPQIINGKGYDHNWVLDVNGQKPEKAAEVYDPVSGRRMEVLTTMPGVQFYSGNFLDGVKPGKNGAVYRKWSGLCLETQYFPNALKHKHFPSPVFKKGQLYRHTTIYRFFT